MVFEGTRLKRAAALVRASIFERVVVVAGGTTAKLAMNAKKHIEKGFPVLEDCMGSFAFLIDADAARGLLVRNDVVGMHKIGSGSSPQAVTQDLVAWVNEGQTVNRTELRELADLYFARFSDRLEERIALSEARFDTKLASLEGRLNTSLASHRAEVASQMRDQMKWMFVFWIGTGAMVIGWLIAR